MECGCYTCTLARDMQRIALSAQWGASLTLLDREMGKRMIVCETCGNKRCPRATDHRLACTDSNKPNQPGSRFCSTPSAMRSDEG